MTIPYPELVPKKQGSHRTPRCRNKKIGRQRRVNLHIVETIRVMVMAGIVIGVGCIGVWIKQLSYIQAKSSFSRICVMLENIPSPPVPSPEQEFVVAYTNSILEQIRQEIHCG